jgi:hypothetical protein
MVFLLRTPAQCRVVYDLFREFSALPAAQGSLFCSFPYCHHIPQYLTATRTLQHADITLLPAGFLMKAFEEIRRANQRDMRPGKI